ncbi:MAG: hypothetical protein INR71_02105 [Terriglobus roseus]|nr:hypothetical protein [Terriglobus roseus]
MNKYKHKLPREDLKKFAKEISKKLVDSDYKHHRVGDPTKVSEKTERGVKKFAKDFFDKCVSRHREHEKRKAEKKAREAKLNGDVSHTPPGEPEAAIKNDDDDEDIKLEVDEEMDGIDDADDATPSDLKRKRESVSLTPNDVPLKDEDSPSSPKKLKPDEPPPPPPPPPVPEGMDLDDAPPDDDAAMMERSAMEDSFVAEAVEAVNGAAQDSTPNLEDDAGFAALPVKLESGDMNGQPSPKQLATPSTNGSYQYDQEKKIEMAKAERLKQEAVAGGR